MLAAVYSGAKQAQPEDVLSGRVHPPKEVLFVTRDLHGPSMRLGPAA